MNTKNGVPESPKVGDQEKKTLGLKDVQELLKRDMGACILMLQAIHDDPDVMDSLAVVLHGKYMNRLHKADLEKQTELAI